MTIQEKRNVKEFFQALFQGTRGYIEVRTVSPTKEVKQYFYRTTSIDRLVSDITNQDLFPELLKDTNIYFGVCPRRGRKGKEEDICQVTSLWTDIDCESSKEREEQLEKLRSFNPSPSILVSSGRGYHAYWLLNKPYSINTRGDLLNIKGYIKGLSIALNGDSAFDLSRVLRVPGTENLKNPHNPLPVRTLEFSSARRYKLGEFERYKVNVEDVVTEVDTSLNVIPDRFWRVLEEDSRLKATWEGKRKDLKDMTRSGYDMALANLLMSYGFSGEEMTAILRSSPSGKGKDTTRHYLALTIGKARKKWQKRNNEGNKLIEQEDDSDTKRQTRKAEKGVKTKTLIPNLIHLIKEDSAVKYLVKKENRLCIQGTFVSNGVVYKPKQDLPIKIPGLDILEESMDINCSKLLDEVIRFIKSHVELPSESGYLILGLWVFHTYLIEKFRWTPILYFYGVKETGKSRAGEVLGELAFRCEWLTSPIEATLFREAEYFKTSLIIDEIKLWGPKGNQDVARLINARYKRGIKVPRVNLNKKGEDQIEYFDVFSPLVICTTESVPDTIESRCITFLMQKNASIEVEKLIDEERSRKLRNKLTIFRANYLDKDLMETRQVARGRLNEIMMPLYQILMLIAPERKDKFTDTVREMERAREEEEGASLEAEIVEKIIEYQNDEKEAAFLTTEIVDRLNQGRPEREWLSHRLVSFRVRRLGFDKIRLKGGKRGFMTKPGLLEKLALQYGLDPPGQKGSRDGYDTCDT